MNISEIERGGRFSFGGYDWILIDPQPDGALVLLDSVPEILRRRPFSYTSTKRKDLADWRRGVPRHVLRHIFMPLLLDNAGQQSDKILEMTVDLTALDGSFAASCTETIALPSLDLYRKNRDVIGEIREAFWTLTRASENLASVVLTVQRGGMVRADTDVRLSAAVLRPVLMLAADTEVTAIPCKFMDAKSAESGGGQAVKA